MGVNSYILIPQSLASHQKKKGNESTMKQTIGTGSAKELVCTHSAGNPDPHMSLTNKGLIFLAHGVCA